MFRKCFAAGVVVVLFLAAVVFFQGRIPQQKELSQDLIRFHVIANSDSNEDQQLKRDVRDAILDQVGSSFAGAATAGQAREMVISKLGQMEEIARKVISDHGKEYAVHAQLGRFDFPVKTYGGFSLPAGNYEAVRIVLGEGKGANWWCVLFPPLCFVDISNNVTAQPPAAEVSKDLNGIEDFDKKDSIPTIELKFKFLEVLDRSKSFIAEWRPKEHNEL